MTARQIEIIENSWDFILLNPEESSEVFYTRLFFLEPSLRQLFKEDINSQAKTLISLITFVVHKLNDMDNIMSDVRELGLRHKKYNVRPEYFAIVGTSLLWTLENKLGDFWNEEVKDAWLTMYSTLSKTMIEAMEEKEIVTI